MIKKVGLITTLFLCIFQSFSQEGEPGKFNWNNVFAGGNVVLGYGAGTASSNFTFGGNPEIGYSIFKNLDLGLCFNLINQSGSYQYFESRLTPPQNVSVDYNYFQSGAGLFARLHLGQKYFIHIQPEFNTIKASGSTNNSSIQFISEKLKSTSFLVGAGFGTHDIGVGNFFTLILVDLQNNTYSPYRNSSGNIVPQIRAGYNFYFKKKKEKNKSNE